MTNNEAISKIKFLLDVGGSDGFTSADKEALNMAINALSTEIIKLPKSNGDKIRQMTDEELVELFDNNGIDCDMCNKHPAQCDYECYCGIVEYLKSEGSKDVGTD